MNGVVLVLLALLLSGCYGSGIYPVEGRVNWRDGTPATDLAGSNITFENAEKKTSSQGRIQADGSFRLTTLEDNDGAPDGEHTVLIMEVGRKSAGGEDPTLMAPGKVDTKYLTPATSDLRAKVTTGANTITLTIDRAPP